MHGASAWGAPCEAGGHEVPGGNAPCPSAHDLPGGRIMGRSIARNLVVVGLLLVQSAVPAAQAQQTVDEAKTPPALLLSTVRQRSSLVWRTESRRLRRSDRCVDKVGSCNSVFRSLDTSTPIQRAATPVGLLSFITASTKPCHVTRVVSRRCVAEAISSPATSSTN